MLFPARFLIEIGLKLDLLYNRCDLLEWSVNGSHVHMLGGTW